MARALLIAGLLSALAAPAFAGQSVTLKPQTIDADGVVTLGDLFDGAGAAARTPVATRAGATVLLNARAVQLAAYRAGLDWANAEGLRSILVTASATGVGAGVAPAQRGNVDVLTYARNLMAGEVVQPADLVWGKAAAAPSDAPADPDAVIGLAAKRPLRAGAAVAARDVAAAQVIKPGETVTVVFQDGGVSLSLEGKALGAGGVGETISIQNPASKKTILAVVAGPGQAMVGPGADLLKSNRSTRYASR